MKFVIQSKLLSQRLSAVSKVISNKNAYAILDNFLFELEGERLVVTGSDMETRITTVIDVPGAEGSGKFALDVKRLMSLLKELPETGMNFDINDETLEVNITYLDGHHNAMAFNGDEYPAKAATEGETVTFQLSEKDIVEGLQSTVFAVGNEEHHPQFMGVFWDLKVDNVTFVASDIHKLVRFRKTKVAPGIERSFILPTKPATVLMSILDKDALDPVNVVVEETSATFEAANYTLTCRFINGRYPNYNAVIPENNPYTLTADRGLLLNALRRVSVSAPSGGLIKMDIQKDSIHLSSQDIDHSASGEETFQCEYDGEPMVMGFRNIDIIGVLANMNCETVLLKLIDPTKAGVFFPGEQADDSELLVLQMPMTL